MERNWITPIIVLLLSGCHHAVKPSEPFEVYLAKPEIMQPCQTPRTDYSFNTFNDVLDARVDDQEVFLKCSSKAQELQSIIEGLTNVKVIRLTTSQSEGGSSKATGDGSGVRDTNNLHTNTEN